MNVFKKSLLVVCLLICISVGITACSAKNEIAKPTKSKENISENVTDKITLDGIKSEFKDKGYDVGDEKPMFDMIKASDGIMFYTVDGKPVKIYEYKSEEEIESLKKDIEIINNLEQNGRFLIETSHSESKEIFLSIGKTRIVSENKSNIKYIKTNNVEIKINSAEKAKEVKEKNSTGVLTFKPENGGFIKVDFEVKNLKSQKDYIFGSGGNNPILEYNDKYKYLPVNNLGEDSLTTNEIAPLVEKDGYVLYDVPEEVFNNVGKCKIKISVEGKEYLCSLSSLEELEKVE